MNLFRIEFDGGTSCNIPRLGFGNGYGSYRIDNEPIHRCNFNQSMSANAAEIRTLEYAIKTIRDRGIKISETTLFLVGDSQIALKWADVAAGNRKATKIQKTSPEFQEAISKLIVTIAGFKVKTKWQPRLQSVATFGH